ncbi:hypothetical protein EDC01DRAFT_626118 [Geopyxis carbonaria]|nr:hypothetical protein EDC01DRAFT_626118 [Geopyxis carbonaria]
MTIAEVFSHVYSEVASIFTPENDYGGPLVALMLLVVIAVAFSLCLEVRVALKEKRAQLEKQRVQRFYEDLISRDSTESWESALEKGTGKGFMKGARSGLDC